MKCPTGCSRNIFITIRHLNMGPSGRQKTGRTDSGLRFLPRFLHCSLRSESAVRDILYSRADPLWKCMAYMAVPASAALYYIWNPSFDLSERHNRRCAKLIVTNAGYPCGLDSSSGFFGARTCGGMGMMQKSLIGLEVSPSI